MFLLLTTAALAATTELNFDEGLLISGFPVERGPPGCAVHFEYDDPDLGWIRYRYGLSAPGTYAEDPDRFLPPHAWGEASRAAPQAPLPTGGGYDWRIVTGEGTPLTAFAGAFAVDARPLAKALDAGDLYRRARAEPECQARGDLECWTALELWLYLEDWQDAHCVAG